jgi:chromosome segregation ATPase
MPSEPRLPAGGPQPSSPEKSGSPDGALADDRFALLSLFPRETDANDIPQETIVTTRPTLIATAAGASGVSDELRGRLRQAELAIRQSVDQAGVFKMELDQLREVARQLAAAYKRIDDAARTEEQRRAEAIRSESAMIEELRGQLRQVELAIKQSLDQAGLFKAELDQLSERESQLAANYRQVDHAARTAEERRAEATRDESLAVEALRGQFGHAELAISQSVEHARAFESDLDQLSETARRLAGDYRQIDEAARAAEERRAEATRNESLAVEALRGQFEHAELALSQSVDHARAFKSDLDELRETALRLGGEYQQIDEAARAAEERRAEATKNESLVVETLRGQFGNAELALSQSVDHARAFKSDLDQLTATALRLAGEYQQIDEAARAAEERRAEATRSESLAIENLRGQLQVAEQAIRHSIDYAGAFGADLDRLRETALQLAGDYQQIDEAARAAEERRAEATSNESLAVEALRGQFGHAELALSQSVDHARAFKSDLDQLQETALRLAGDYQQMDEAARAAEERRAEATRSESSAVEALRGQLGRAEFTIKQTVDHAGAFKKDLDQLRETALQLASDYWQIDDAARTAEERRTEATKSESLAIENLRRQLRQAELAIKQSVDQAAAFKTEMDQLREGAQQLGGDYTRIDEAARAAEERRVEATRSESAAIEDLRGQLHGVDLAIRQSVERAVAFKTDLDQLRETALQLASDYRQIDEAARRGEDRRAEATESESAVVEDLRWQLQEAGQAIKQSMDQAGAFTSELQQLREHALGVEGEFRLLEDATRSADERNVAILKAVSVIESRLDALAGLQEHVTRADARLVDMGNRAEEKADRVAEAISAMETRFARVKEDFQIDLARFERNVQDLLESVRSRVDERVVEKRRFRLGVWHSLSRWFSAVVAAFRTQKLRLVRYHQNVVGGLSALALVSLTIVSVLNDPVRIRPVVPEAQPILAPSTIIPSDVMLRTAVLTVPRMPSLQVQTMLPPAPTAVPQPEPPQPAQPAQPAQSPRDFTGTLEIQSDPAGAAVFINREKVGETPLLLSQVRVGSHVISVELQGYQRWTAAARVVADVATRLDVKLEPQSGAPGSR